LRSAFDAFNAAIELVWPSTANCVSSDEAATAFCKPRMEFELARMRWRKVSITLFVGAALLAETTAVGACCWALPYPPLMMLMFTFLDPYLVP
jgi:hypothetical protein